MVGIHGERRSEKPSKENPHGPLRDDRGMNEGHRGKLQRKGFLMSVRKRQNRLKRSHGPVGGVCVRQDGWQCPYMRKGL